MVGFWSTAARAVCTGAMLLTRISDAALSSSWSESTGLTIEYMEIVRYGEVYNMSTIDESLFSPMKIVTKITPTDGTGEFSDPLDIDLLFDW